MARERIIWLDNLKVFLISMVVLGHVLLFTSPVGSHNFAYRLISSFWMPLFMFSSGFASYRIELGWDIVKRRFFQLMIPFLSWSVILCALKGTCHLEQMFLYPTQSMWFLFALFFIVLIHVSACMIAKRIGVRAEVAVALVAAVLWGLQGVTKSKLFCTNLISYHFVFYSLGFYGRKFFDKFSKLPGACVFAMFMVFLLMACFRDESYYQIIHLPKSCYILYDFVCALFSIGPALYLFGRKVDKLLSITKLGGGYTRNVCFPYTHRPSTLRFSCWQYDCIF